MPGLVGVRAEAGGERYQTRSHPRKREGARLSRTKKDDHRGIGETAR